jgi:hypothetical protein
MAAIMEAQVALGLLVHLAAWPYLLKSPHPSQIMALLLAVAAAVAVAEQALSMSVRVLYLAVAVAAVAVGQVMQQTL